MSLWHVTVTVHLLAAMIWLGGMMALALLAPVLRSAGDEVFRQRLFQAVGVRFRTVGWICIAVLVATGVAQLRIRGWWGWALWSSPGFWGTPLGRSFLGKLVSVTVMLVAQAFHDFSHGPRAGRLPPGSDEARRMRRTASLLARANAVLGIVVIYFAVRLARGG